MKENLIPLSNDLTLIDVDAIHAMGYDVQVNDGKVYLVNDKVVIY